MRSARELPAAQQEALFDIVKDWPGLEPWALWLSIVGTFGWVLAVGYLAVVARAAGAPRSEWLFIAAAALFFRWDTPRRSARSRSGACSSAHSSTSGNPPGFRTAQSLTCRDRPSTSELVMQSRNTGGEPGGRGRTWRRIILLGVPVLYVLLGFLHPMANPGLGDETDLFIGLHIAQLLLIVGLGNVLWLLVEGVTNRPATLARALIIPFVVACTALDAVLGIAWGLAAEAANELPATDQQGAGRLVDELISGDADPRGLILYWGAGLLWLAVMLAIVAALSDTAPLGALISMALGAAVFTLGHAPPMGPVGMGLLLLGIAWAEFRPRPANALS